MANFRQPLSARPERAFSPSAQPYPSLAGKSQGDSPSSQIRKPATRWKGKFVDLPPPPSSRKRSAPAYSRARKMGRSEDFSDAWGEKSSSPSFSICENRAESKRLLASLDLPTDLDVFGGLDPEKRSDEIYFHLAKIFALASTSHVSSISLTEEVSHLRLQEEKLRSELLVADRKTDRFCTPGLAW
ncbi:hypothetical protein CASFOL_000492 [Castilleja foliolosa]|uniref:Uncharacterized protein n=1 Tax=Castilleja foliolosa TaxID=1961234 RepID=A0ABD3ES84_9LAMI